MPPAHAWSVSSAVRAPTAVSPFPGCVTASKTALTMRTKGGHNVMEHKYSYTYKTFNIKALLFDLEKIHVLFIQI